MGATARPTTTRTRTRTLFDIDPPLAGAPYPCCASVPLYRTHSEPRSTPMRSLRFAGAALSLLTVGIATPRLFAQQHPSNRIALEQYLDWEDVQAPQLSPDGTQILFTRRWVDKMNDKWESSIWLMNADGTPSAFAHARLRREVVARRQAHRLHRQGRAQRPADLRSLDGRAKARRRRSRISPSRRRRSSGRPTERSLAFNMNVPVKESWRIAMPTPPKGAKWTEAPKVVTRLNYRSDRIGYTDDCLPPHLRHSRRRRHGAPDHDRRLEPFGAVVLAPTASGSRSRACASRTPRTRSASRRSTPRTSRRARSSSSPIATARTAARRSRPTARRSPSCPPTPPITRRGPRASCT